MHRSRSLILGLLGLACFAGWALGQNNRQYGTDPSGAIGVDANQTLYFARHLIAADARPPVLSGCGTTPSVVGNDAAGKITTGSAATTCTATFALAYAVAPACIVAPQGNATYPTYTTSTTAIVFSVDIASTVYNYVCFATG